MKQINYNQFSSAYPGLPQNICIAAASFLDAHSFAGNAGKVQPWPNQVPPDHPDFNWNLVFKEPCTRFDRMDELCRWSLAAVELLGLNALLSDSERMDTAVYMSTATGSAKTDAAYLQGMNLPGGASPMLFAYTLPSTALGEICIRFKLQGPLLCCSCPEQKLEPILQEAVRLLNNGMTKTCICVSANATDAPGASALLLRWQQLQSNLTKNMASPENTENTSNPEQT